MLVSEPFLPLGTAQAATLEYPDARLVAFRHPLAGIDDDGVRERADAVVDRVLESLLRRPA